MIVLQNWQISIIESESIFGRSQDLKYGWQSLITDSLCAQKKLLVRACFYLIHLDKCMCSLLTISQRYTENSLYGKKSEGNPLVWILCRRPEYPFLCFFKVEGPNIRPALLKITSSQQTKQQVIFHHGFSYLHEISDPLHSWPVSWNPFKWKTEWKGKKAEGN